MEIDHKAAVLVIGSLGEVIKKSIELDFKCLEDYHSISVHAESLALKKLLDEWPVLDATRVFLLRGAMCQSIMKYKQAEKELESMSTDNRPNTPGTCMLYRQTVTELFRYRDEIRFQMNELNKQSGGVGKASAIPPDAELVIAKLGE